MRDRHRFGTLKNPTGLPVRVDRGGNGHFGSRRSLWRDGELYRYNHKGQDNECVPGQDVRAPIYGKVQRIAYPHDPSKSPYSGLIIENPVYTIKMLYLAPLKDIVGKYIEALEVIGQAQDISLKYPGSGVTPHIHTEIVSISMDPDLYMEGQTLKPT
ncbi:hypothetical protein LCGC14_0384530 [marine sediment metagenome]|uniref:Peptidase M23 domain-containing protein n=1 Tax=marine sediment metagenome TaxID=412755 RepID=A0A0F9T7A7_9ZZZZ